MQAMEETLMVFSDKETYQRSMQLLAVYKFVIYEAILRLKDFRENNPLLSDAALSLVDPSQVEPFRLTNVQADMLPT